MERRDTSVRIKDVARVAGVSVGTVSNVLNRPDSVSDALREKVMRVISTLGYVPNDAARQLKAGVSRSVGLVVVDTRNPFYDAIALAAQDAAESVGLGLFVANSQGRPERERFYLAQFEQQRARGVLVTPAGADLTRHREIGSRGVRVVLVDAPVGAEGFCCVSADDYHGGYLAVRHLIESGRKRITVLGGPRNFHQVESRLAGARKAAEGAGVSLDYAAPTEMTISAGRAMGEAIAEEGHLPDAVFAMNDMLATGVLQALVMQRGLDVPGDIALVGYDDIDFCQDAVIPITSIRQPSAHMGREALRLLEAEVADEGRHEHTSLLLKPELVARASTGGDSRNRPR